MSQPIALLDANVLYSSQIRDLLLQLAKANLFLAKWTDSIQDEWMDARLRNDPDLERKTLENLRKLMETETLNARVTGYENLIDSLTLPDPDDRHVLAAAIVGECNVIITQNLKDFTEESLSPHDIMAQHPDDFMLNLLKVRTKEFCAAIRIIRGRLKNPPYTVERYLENLNRTGLHMTSSRITKICNATRLIHINYRVDPIEQRSPIPVVIRSLVSLAWDKSEN